MAKQTHRDGLDYHLSVLREGSLKRRDVVRWALGAGLVTLVGCGDDADSIAAGSGGQGGKGGSGGSSGGSSDCTKIPEETAGPYPADGSNSASSGGPGGDPPGSGARAAGGSGGSSSASVINALSMSGIMRRDIRSSFGGSSSTKAEGVALSIKLRIRDTSCKVLDGAAVYLWHCDRSGNYSLYSQAIASENYLRGVQVTDADGVVEFESIFPACYSGRWPHIHFEVYPSLTKATLYSNKIATSQLALPKDACDIVFAEDGYAASITNFKMISLTTDNVFSDGSATQQAAISGSLSDGYEVSLDVNVDA